MTETLVHNARFRTMDPTNPSAEWLLVRDGRVAALGLVSTKTIGDADHLIRAAGVAGVGYLIAHT